MTTNSTVWFSDHPRTPKWIRHLKATVIRQISGTRLKVQIDSDQKHAGEFYSVDSRLLTDKNPLAGHVTAEIASVPFDEEAFQINQVEAGLVPASPVHRPAASLADILGGFHARSA